MSCPERQIEEMTQALTNTLVGTAKEWLAKDDLERIFQRAIERAFPGQSVMDTISALIDHLYDEFRLAVDFIEAENLPEEAQKLIDEQAERLTRLLEEVHGTKVEFWGPGCGPVPE